METNEWCVLQPMLETHCEPVLVELDGYIYAIGNTDSRDEQLSSNKVERYSIASGEWQVCAPLIQVIVTKVRALACNGRIFVIGIDIEKDAIEVPTYMVYNPLSNEWIGGNVIKNFADLDSTYSTFRWFGLYQNVWYLLRLDYKLGYLVHRVTCNLESDKPTITIGPPVDDLAHFGSQGNPPQYLTFDKRKLGMQKCDDPNHKYQYWKRKGARK